MEALIACQKENWEKMQNIKTNFGKDSEIRKTVEYVKIRLEALDNLWADFEKNHLLLKDHPHKTEEPYFTEDIYSKATDIYKITRNLLIEQWSKQQDIGKHQVSGNTKSSAATQWTEKIDELMNQQETNFRAFNRLIAGIELSKITEKWELEDELRNVQSKWNVIDTLHLQIDNFLQGEDKKYEERLSKIESTYKNMKRELNKKLSSTAHLQQSTPQLEIPIFTGKYTQWPTFYDLFYEAIHNSTLLTKTQKMQHLKGKLKGEAERLIQHLNITAENYDIAWELLIHRYNNPQVLFSKQMDIFLNQPAIQRQTSFDLKRLYDTSTECIHAIHNLGIDTTSWDPLLVHLICKKLDMDTYSDYKEARKAPRELPSLDELMTFLEGKFTALETINHKRERITSNLNKQHPNNRHTQEKPFNRPSYQKSYPAYTASVPTNRCPFCNQEHPLYLCKNFISMNYDQKLRTVTKLQVCQNCLHVHRNTKCNSTKRCKECNGTHNTMLHESFDQRRSSPANTSKSVSPMTSKQITTASNKQQHNVNHVASEDEEILLTTLLIRIKAANGNYVTLRALLDQGSQISLITERAAQLLGLTRQRYSASVLGVGNGTKQSKGIVTLQCQSIHDDFSFVTKALVVTKLINNLPTSSFTQQAWPHLQNINLADPEYNISKPTDLLLDASVYSDIIMSGLIKGPARAPIAQQTKLGWILSGNVQTKTFNCHVVINNLEEIAKYWELEDVDSSSLHLTPEEQYCEEYYQATTKRLEDGRYQVALPMKPGYTASLGQSKFKAIGQFRQQEYKFARNTQLAEDYKAFMDEYRNLGHMRIATKTNHLPYYLPHHGVLRLESTTTKLRVVFNGSAKTSSGLSLNDVMECGPNLQKDLMKLILQWRQYTFVLTADIEKMYRQILIREDDLHLQRTIWRDSPQEPLQEYELTTVTYGTKAAPYLAMRTLQQLARDEATKYPLAAPAVEHSFYMDDLLSGHHTLDQAKELQRQLIAIMKSAGMNLRKWSSNAPELVKDLAADKLNTPFNFKCTETRKTLGLKWNSQPDTFTFHSTLSDQVKQGQHTKRELLSKLSKLFDPLGWLSPISIRAKLLFQKAWETETSWDIELPSHIQKEWIALRGDFENINQFEIPRYLGNILKNYEIHCFCDASEKAYACVVYIVTADDKGVRTSNIVAAKTKLAPLKKKVSLPRLELCGALLSSQLVNKILEAIPHGNATIYAWTDSMVVLGWLQGNINRWSKFIANRVQQITNIIPASQWHHVKSEENAADCATRGLTSKQLTSDQTLWWRGPQWILDNPKDIKTIQYPEPDIEVRKTKLIAVAQLENEPIIKQLLCKHSSINRVAKILSWVARFIARCRNTQTQQNVYETQYKSLTSTEINRAYEQMIKYVQSNEFAEEINDLRKMGHVKTNSKLANLCPFVDSNGLLRVGGRLKNSSIDNTAKHPYILPKQSRFTELVIEQAHKTTLHGGAKLTLSHLRNKYWILGSMNIVKKQLRLCLTCRHFNQQNLEQVMADLPKPQVMPSRSRPLTHCAVDFTSHVEVKANKGRSINTKRIRRKISKYTVSSILFTLLSLLTLSTQQEITSPTTVCNITSLQNSNQGLYFDQVTELQHIIDEWKLVVYYNMSTYWNGLSNMDEYILHLKELCTPNSQYNSIVYQLSQEMEEIRHYNRLLKQHSLKRQKRGLINGAGYLANTLFGVLEDRFAQQYEKDIVTITKNENHLRNLIRNQTVVIEAEYNVLKRNELSMNKQFSFIRDRLKTISIAMDKVTQDYKNALYVTSSALAASIIISNLRRMQQSLLDTVTDISHGQIDMHLISPEQLDEQINLISSHLRGGLALPVTKDEIKDIYKLLKASGRVVNDYLIIEIKIPLVSNDVYELNKIISIPQKRSNNLSYQITSKLPYIAYNIRKDTVILLSEGDIQSCISSSNRILCSFDKPIYDLSLKQSFCSINVSHNNPDSPCISSLSTCRDQWIKLHRQNAWLFSCCNECNVRIFCPSASMTMKSLKDNGIIDIGQGCAMKSDSFSIYAHNNYLNFVYVNKKIDVPQISVLNKLLNTSIHFDYPPVEDNDQKLNEIKEQISLLKNTQSEQLTVHDVHHYTISYIIVFVILVVGSIFVFTKIRSKLLRRVQVTKPEQQSEQQQPQQGLEGGPAPRPRPNLSASVSDVSASVSAVSDIVRSQSLFSLDRGTSPMVSRSVKFNVPIQKVELNS